MLYIENQQKLGHNLENYAACEDTTAPMWQRTSPITSSIKFCGGADPSKPVPTLCSSFLSPSIYMASGGWALIGMNRAAGANMRGRKFKFRKASEAKKL